MNKAIRHALGLLTLAAVSAGGCTSGSDDARVEVDPVETQPVVEDPIDEPPLDDESAAQPDDTDPVETERLDTDPLDTAPPDTAPVEEESVEEESVETEPVVEPTEAGVRNDVECTPEGLDDTGDYDFIAAYFVVGGELGEVCFGDDDDGRLREAWDTLAAISPTGQLVDLGLFGAFSETTPQAEDTLAFVNSLDVDGSLFQMSVNVDAYGVDPVEARVTMAHEFAHVFTATPSQLDRSDEAYDNCTTYDNGEGCYTEESIMAQWIELFWADGLIDEIDPLADPTPESGEDRCTAHAGFFGPYAASSPEEDFAESFGAFVFDVEDPSPDEQLRLDWIGAQPGLAEFRDRAIAVGLTPVPNNFEICGKG